MKNLNKNQRIGKITSVLDGVYWRISKLSDVKENLFWLLYVLDDGEFHSQKQICEDWSFPKTTINTLIKECESEGYITLKSIPGKKRELQICLTEKGMHYAQEVLKPVYEIESAAIQNTLKKSPTFIEDFERFSSELFDSLENYIKKEKE
jgi:DNA-binding MarR family transcriptional regulator